MINVYNDGKGKWEWMTYQECFEKNFKQGYTSIEYSKDVFEKLLPEDIKHHEKLGFFRKKTSNGNTVFIKSKN